MLAKISYWQVTFSDKIIFITVTIPLPKWADMLIYNDFPPILMREVKFLLGEEIKKILPEDILEAATFERGEAGVSIIDEDGLVYEEFSLLDLLEREEEDD